MSARKKKSKVRIFRIWVEIETYQLQFFHNTNVGVVSVLLRSKSQPSAVVNNLSAAEFTAITTILQSGAKVSYEFATQGFTADYTRV